MKARITQIVNFKMPPEQKDRWIAHVKKVGRRLGRFYSFARFMREAGDEKISRDNIKREEKHER